ncbi:hypothetical protein CEE45_09775 [Candidatus Heimdallarchaeota archaeon B3_Heim]|nr:MAG: hypothetical protein CEE45_09775 [Candidatus Heimdallarchaeota archaeon B3_Heim]
MVIGKIMRFTLTQMSKRRLPITDGQIDVEGLRGKSVEIIRDKWGIPHIFADHSHDLFFAQGFVQAQDRLWQMEINRRTANGTLSEIFGDIAIETDRTARTFGFARLGKIDWDNASEEVKECIQAYANGVNAFLKHKKSKLPVEFTLIRHRPEVWTPQDCCAFTRVMLWQLSHAWLGELIRAKIVEEVGSEHAAELEISFPDTHPITLPNGIEFNVLDKNGILSGSSGPFLARSQGSNTWVISSERSTSGHTYLCNDMHLSLMLPSIWYETHLIGAGFNISGVSLSGNPLILVGHNQNIAWGSTLAFTDAEDLFIEKMNEEDPTQYEVNDKWVDAEVIEEEIIVKGQEEPHIEKVLITRHGPIISDVIEGTKTRIATNSMALKPSQALQGYFLLNKAANWNQFVEAMQFIDATQLNMSYADVNNNIGYWVTGKVPIRANGHKGNIPVPGWNDSNEWQGEVPFESMPHALNPKQGYIISCNHKIVPDDFPYFLGEVWMNGARAKRFEQILTDKGGKLSVEDFKAMQMDVTCLPGQQFVEFVRDLEIAINDDTEASVALQLLTDWNGVLSTDSIGGAIYEVLRYNIVRDILSCGLSEKLVLEIMGKGFNPVLYHANEFYGHDTYTIMRLLKTPNSWWIQEAGGTKEIIIRNLKKTAIWLSSSCGKKPTGWQWGKLHKIHFPHALGLKKPLDQVFDRGNIPIGGDTDTLCQTAIHADDPYDVNAWAPSHRQIIDMNDLSKSLMIYAPGQSGHLASKHYDDLIPIWYNGEYHPMLWERADIIARAEGRLILKWG